MDACKSHKLDGAGSIPVPAICAEMHVKKRNFGENRRETNANTNNVREDTKTQKEVLYG